MHTLRIKLADTVIAAEVNNEFCIKTCRDYLSDEKPDIFIRITSEDLEKELTFAENKAPTEQTLEWVALYRKICTELASKDIVLIHGSCVSVDGQAYLFCAPSGTGKSTHTRLWREYLGTRAVMINDDKPLVRIVNNTAIIYGTPWNGKHRIGSNISAPLKAICFLSRGKENSIKRMDPKDAIPMLIKYTFRPEDPLAMINTLDTITKTYGISNFWSLRCNMSLDAAAVSFTAMSEE